MSKLQTESFQEPGSDAQLAGVAAWDAPKLPYEEFMEEEGIPVYRSIISVHNVRELDLAPWERLGGNGAFLYFDGLEGIKGMYVLEIPGGSALHPERHLYHEFYLVLEGRGTTETWIEGESERQIVEWQPGSLFYLPPNVMHRCINATQERALIIAATNAPPLYNTIRDRTFIFDNDYLFERHYSRGDPDYFNYEERMVAMPGNKRAQLRSNYYPDIITMKLPRDNYRVPGYRHLYPAFRGFEHDHNGFISEYPVGRYSRAHYHEGGAVLVCLQGRGYSFNWPLRYGTTPWQDGHGDEVRVAEYEEGGLVVAAPGGGMWYHQHFPLGTQAARFLYMWGGPTPVPLDARNRETGVNINLTLEQGGQSIGYSKEDPFVRKLFEERLGEFGLRSQMAPALYERD